MKFSFVKNQKIFFGIVIAMLIIGIASFFIRGFNFDIDFVGGTEISYDLGATITKDDEAAIASAVKDIIGADNFSSIRVSGDNKNVATVRTLVLDNSSNASDVRASVENAVKAHYADAVLTDDSMDESLVFTRSGEDAVWTDEDADAVEAALADTDAQNVFVSASDDTLLVSYETSTVIGKLRSDITEAIGGMYQNAVWQSTNTVSAEVSAGLKSTAILATVIAVILMLVYIAFRFQVSSAFAAILCLAHDLFIMLTAYSLLQIPVNSNIIAALLTILGYSINATIIIFDRIRENDHKMGSSVPFADKVDDGIRSTVLRSINTTVTTLLTIGMIYLLGVTSIKDFALPIIVGIVAGLFSSVCLAGPLWNLFKKKGGKR